MISRREIYFATEGTENTEIFSTLINTAFARLAFFGKTFFPKRASSKGRCLARECLRPSLLSQAKDTDLIDRVFKNNDQLKTNTALHKEAAKIEFKVI